MKKEAKKTKKANLQKNAVSKEAGIATSLPNRALGGLLGKLKIAAQSIKSNTFASSKSPIKTTVVSNRDELAKRLEQSKKDGDKSVDKLGEVSVVNKGSKKLAPWQERLWDEAAKKGIMARTTRTLHLYNLAKGHNRKIRFRKALVYLLAAAVIVGIATFSYVGVNRLMDWSAGAVQKIAEVLNIPSWLETVSTKEKPPASNTEKDIQAHTSTHHEIQDSSLPVTVKQPEISKIPVKKPVKIRTKVGNHPIKASKKPTKSLAKKKKKRG